MPLRADDGPAPLVPDNRLLAQARKLVEAIDSAPTVQAQLERAAVAAEKIGKAVRAGNRNPFLLRLLARALAAQLGRSNMERAVRVYRASLTTARDYRTWYDLARLLELLDRDDEAIAAHRSALAFDLESPYPHWRLAILHARAKSAGSAALAVVRPPGEPTGRDSREEPARTDRALTRD